MNCKPGDLAVIVRDTFPENVGRVVEVVALVEQSAYHQPGANWWVLCATPIAIGYYDESAGVVHRCGAPLNKAACLDADLRPIRDPGQDATDETLLWLSAPKQTEAA